MHHHFITELLGIKDTRVDVENRRIIDILPDQKVETIEEYLKSCDTGKVEIVVMDSSRGFKQAIRKALGNPLIIADRIRMKRSKKLLWESWTTCSDNQKKKVQQLLEIDTRLKEAYDLKHALVMWFKESDEYNAAAELEACLKQLKASTLDGFHRVARTSSKDPSISYLSL